LHSLWRTKSLGLCTFLFFISVASVANENTKNIHVTCERNPEQCLAELPSYLSSVPLHSRVWFQYKLYQVNAMFELLLLDDLLVEISPWINATDIPLKFKLSVHIYYAKLMKSKGFESEANQYLQKSIQILQDVNEVSPDPMLEVQIANTLNSLGLYQQGYDLLLPLEEKYKNRHMPKFKHELYENLGHFAYRLGDLDKHVEYRLLALQWAKEFGNLVQEAISTYNVARSYQMLEAYEKAFEYFLIAEQLQAIGESDQNMIWYRRAEMSLAQGNVKDAQTYFSKVNRVTSSKSYQKMFAQLEDSISKAQTVN
jgi:tetratricopeptide (TPR) repeat protein